MTIRTSMPPCWAGDRTPHHRRLHSDIPHLPCRLEESIFVVNTSIHNGKHHRRWASSNAPVENFFASRAAEVSKIPKTTAKTTTLSPDCLLSWGDLNSSTSTNKKATTRDPLTNTDVMSNDNASYPFVSRAASNSRILSNLARSAEEIANPAVITSNQRYTDGPNPKRSATDKLGPCHTTNGNDRLTEAQRPTDSVRVAAHKHQSQEKYHRSLPASHNTPIQDSFSGSHVSGAPSHNYTGLLDQGQPHKQPATHSNTSRTMAATLPANPVTPIMAAAPLSPTSNRHPVQSLVESVVHVVEIVHEQHKRAQCRKRISQTLLTLRAAAEVQHQWEQQQQQQQQPQQRQDDGEAREGEDTRPKSNANSSQDLGLYDLGSALFCPLMDPVLQKRHSHSHYHARGRRLGGGSISTADTTDMDSSEGESRISSSGSLPIATVHPLPHNIRNDEDHHQDEKRTTEEDEFRPVHILPEFNMNDNPRLLSDGMFQQLITDGVPECLHMNAWERIYSMGRDGDSFRTLLDRCTPYQYSIMVVQTTSGYLLGGFVSDAWQEQDGFHQRHSYYGTGVSFLFASHPATSNDNNTNNNTNADETEDRPLSIFPWTGSNDFCQICDMERNVIAMGGSGAFGFILEDNFFRGSTDRSGTFDNPPLTPDKDGIFTVAAMEVYGLVPLFEKPTHHQYRRECPTGSGPRSTVLSTMASAMIDHLH